MGFTVYFKITSRKSEGRSNIFCYCYYYCFKVQLIEVF